MRVQVSVTNYFIFFSKIRPAKSKWMVRENIPKFSKPVLFLSFSRFSHVSLGSFRNIAMHSQISDPYKKHNSPLYVL